MGELERFLGEIRDVGSLNKLTDEPDAVPPEPDYIRAQSGPTNGAKAQRAAHAEPWPEKLDEAALYGLAGEVVRAIEPHTEADPVALLTQLLVYFGNVIGRRAHCRVEADRHYANEFVLATGATAKGRKGTSEGRVRALFDSIEESEPEGSESLEGSWVRTRLQSGLSSGEGLIWAVRDPIVQSEPLRDKNKKVTGYQKVTTDPGVDDKRLLVQESEFAAALKVAARDGNTLSPTMRQAWDTGRLRILTKNNPGSATDAHISIVGHITKPELLRQMSETDMANGFANRFLFVAVKRSKCLPEGGGSVEVGELVNHLREAVRFGARQGEVKRDWRARKVWAAVYPMLSDGQPGLLGAATSRAEAHVLRLSLIYALLDLSPVIRAEHVIAALAVWDYCLASARWIFGAKIGDTTCDEILQALRRSQKPLSRTDISDLFGRHKSSTEIGRALDELVSLGLVTCERVTTSGRTADYWRVTSGGSLSSLVSQSGQTAKGVPSFAAMAKQVLCELTAEGPDAVGSCEESEGSEAIEDLGLCVYCGVRPAIVRGSDGLAYCDVDVERAELDEEADQ